MALFQKLQRTVCKLTRPVVQKANTTGLAESEEDEETCDYAVALQNCLIGLANEVYGVADPRDISGRVLRQACDFYDADWCGLFDVDRMLKLLVPFWWYNRTTGGMTKTKLDEGGVYGDFTRWMDALNTNTPIYVDDIEKIKESNPEEYAVYSKQEVRSILAVPYHKREKGFLLLRNPKRYGDKPEMLQIMANILVAEINEQKHLDRMKAESENMDTSAEIVINLFGGLEIITNKGTLSEAEIKSPLACKLLVLLMMNRHRSMTGRELADAIWPDADYTDPTGKLRTLLYRFRTTFRLLSDKELIVTSANGYRINSELTIRTDYEDFERTCEVSKKAYDRYQKKELLCKAVKLYRGKLFPTGSSEHWLLACNSKYHLQYLAIVEELMTLLHAEKNYSMMQKPEATLVAGYGAWQNKFERNVKKGEKAIKIFAPAPRKVEVERDMLDPETQRPVIDENGEVKKEKVTVQQPYFKITSVFDVSQTDGKPLPELDTVQDLTGSVEGYNIFFEALKRTSKVPMDFQPIEGGSHGFYHQIEKRIAIAEGMSEAQNVKTGIHEIAHSRLHDRDMIDAENGIMVDRRTREVQAESVAYTVCQHYGIETSDYSFGYIAGWSEGKEMKELRSSMEVIRREADSMIKEIDGHLADIRKEREQETEITAEAEKSFIAKYYVVEDLQVRGALQIEKFDDLETALNAYFALPDDKVRALGIENSKPRTGSLDFIHCHDGVDEIVQDYQKVEGWMNPEIIAVVDRIQTVLEEREATEQSHVNPMYQNYLDIKAENADRIVLYQVGDFFEAFNADAETLAKDLDLMLTSRPISETERVPLVGLPKHNLENYVEKLQAQGHKITIAALDEGERKIYQMASPQSEEPAIPLTSENAEPSQALNGYSRKDVEEMVLFAAQAELEEMELSESVKLLGARVYGSRTRDGLFEESSDIDVVLSFDAPNGVLYEDTFFNAINGNHLEMGGLTVDVNPISLQETGTLEDYMTRAEAYLDRKELHKAVYAHLANSTDREADVLQAAKITFPEAKGDTLQKVLQSAAIPKLREQAEVMDGIEVFGHEGVFTNGRVNKKDLPEGLYAYDLRGSDDDPGQFVTIEPFVMVNHAGAVVLSEKLDFGEKERLELGEDWTFSGEAGMTLESFYEKVVPGKGEAVYAKDVADISEKALAFYGSETKLFDYLGDDRETILTDLVEQLNHGFVAYMDEKNLTAETEITEAEEPTKPIIVPLSNLTLAEAKEKGEVDSWRASKKETEACADQFDAQFGMAYHERRMPEFLAEMADKYGMDRCKIVLASTIQLADHDGRYYPSTKADAAKVNIPGADTEDYSKDIRMNYRVNCHPVMVNSAFRELQKMEREQTQAKTKEPAAVEHDSKAPKASVLSRLQDKQKQVSQNKTSPARTEDKKRGVEL